MVWDMVEWKWREMEEWREMQNVTHTEDTRAIGFDINNF